MADIQLSSQLFQDIQQAVQRQHADADPGVVMQYLAAVMGYMLGSQRGMSMDERAAFMDELLYEIGEHIGVSIRGLGRHTTGEAEGRQGRIISEIVAGKSVDFVCPPT